MNEPQDYNAAQMREAFIAGGMSKLQFRDYLEAEALRRWPEKPGEEKP